MNTFTLSLVGGTTATVSNQQSLSSFVCAMNENQGVYTTSTTFIPVVQITKVTIAPATI